MCYFRSFFSEFLWLWIISSVVFWKLSIFFIFFTNLKNSTSLRVHRFSHLSWLAVFSVDNDYNNSFCSTCYKSAWKPARFSLSTVTINQLLFVKESPDRFQTPTSITDLCASLTESEKSQARRATSSPPHGIAQFLPHLAAAKLSAGDQSETPTHWTAAAAMWGKKESRPETSIHRSQTIILLHSRARSE